MSDRLWALTGFIVLCSILIHGVTSTPLMRLLERRGDGREPREKAEGDVVA